MPDDIDQRVGLSEESVRDSYDRVADEYTRRVADEPTRLEVLVAGREWSRRGVDRG